MRATIERSRIAAIGGRAARLVLALVLAGPAPVWAQAPPAGVVTTLSGQAVVARAAAPAPVALKFKDSVFVRDRIETRQDSIVRVLLGGKALVTVRELSVFTVTEEPGRARIDLAEGKAAVGVAKRLLRPGEVIEIRTPNAVAAVRGSEIVAEVALVGGVPQSTITALDVSLPVTVTPLGDPTRAVTLGINQAVSVLGLAAAATLSPVRTLTPPQAQEAARAAQAPKPREQSDKPPERIARKVSEEKTQEAVQLSEAVAGDSSALAGTALSRTMSAELDAAEQTYRRTQELLDITNQRLDEIFEATGALIERAFSSERLSPGFVLEGQALALGAVDTVSFAGTQQFAFNPILGVVNGAEMVQTGQADLFAVAPGANIGLEGSLVFVGFDSLVSTEGNLFSVGTGATFTSGFGGSAFVAVQFGSLVVSGGSIVAIGPGATATFARPLLFVDETSAVFVGADPAVPAHVIDIGRDAQVRLEQALELLSVSGTIVATGRLLSVAEGASLTIDTAAGGLSTLALFPAEGQPAGATAVFGREMIALEPRARLATNQVLLSIFASTVTVGADLLSLGTDAQLTISGTELISIGGAAAGPSAVTVAGNLVSLAAGARLVSESDLTLPLIGFDASTVSVGADLVAVRSGAVLRLGPQSLLLVSGGAALSAAGSLLSVGAGAEVALAETLTLPVFLIVGSSVSAGGDMVLLAPDAAMAFSRPLVLAVDSTLVGRSVLALGARAALTVPDPTTDALIRVFGTGGASLGADAVALGTAARVDLARPLIQTADTAAFTAGGSMLTLGPSASLTSVGPGGDFALLEFAGGPARAGGPAVAVDAGARLALERPLLGSFGSDLTLPGGALRVRGGGQVTTSSAAQFFVGLGGGTHAIGTAQGASVFDLAGVTTAADAESGLTLGTDRPVRYDGALLIAAGAQLTTGRVARLDTALLEATAPLLDLRRSTATASTDVMDLTLRAKLGSVGPLATLDGSSLSVLAGAFTSVAGGSFLKVTGDLLELRNASTLRLLNGPVLSVTGGSAVSISGALVAFGGTGGNAVNIANSLCPCTLVGGLPVAFQNGAVASNVSIGGNPIRNPGLGTVSFSSPGAAAIVVSGANSRVIIGGVPQ
jgi:FecR-like protein